MKGKMRNMQSIIESRAYRLVIEWLFRIVQGLDDIKGVSEDRAAS